MTWHGLAITAAIAVLALAVLNSMVSTSVFIITAKPGG
jgi:hypothetical protein